MRHLTAIPAFLAISFFFYLSVFSQETSDNRMLETFKARIKSQEFLNNDKMLKLQSDAAQFSLDDKVQLYDSYSKSGSTKWGGFLLNMLIFPGAGNLSVGDSYGAPVIFGGYVTGLGIAGLGFALMFHSWDYPSYSSDNILNGNLAAACIAVGLAQAVGFYFGGLITPLTYSDDHNRRLAATLKLNNDDLDRYAKNVDAVVPMLANVLPGFGLGSFIQGDNLGGVIGLSGGILGGIMIFAGDLSVARSFSLSTVISTGYDYVGHTNTYEDRTADVVNARNNSMALLIAGITVTSAIYIFEIIRPFWFAADINVKKARNQKSTTVNVTFDPYFVPDIRNNEFGLGFGLNCTLSI